MPETRDDSSPASHGDRDPSPGISDGSGPQHEEPGEVERPDEAESPSDGTLGGYMSEHGRPPSFEGSDRHPYTVSVEVEQIGDLRSPFAGYLIFPQWSHGGGEIVGHVQTPLLARGRTHRDVVDALGQLRLMEIKELLEEGIERQRTGEAP